MTQNDDWWTAPTEGDNGQLVMVTGRDSIDKARNSGKYKFRVDITWDYRADASGMPNDMDAELMDQATEALKKEFANDPVAILTGIYTGAGRRDWVFYALNLNLFSKVFNRALADLPTLPIVIEAHSDPDWQEYREMRDISYIPPED